MVEGKGEIRKVMRARRKAVPAEERAAVSSAICKQLLARDDVRAAIAAKAPIAVYLASPDEIDLADFIAAALAQGAALVAPRWNGTCYELAALESLDDLVPGPHGILEPSSAVHLHLSPPPQIWLIPGLAFTKTGKRLGYGGGWYDRLLARADVKSVKIGLGYGFQLMDDLPSEPHDVLLSDVLVKEGS